MTATDIGVQTLKELVRRFRICWEVSPEYAFVNKSKGARPPERQQVGFELELSGTHEPGVEHPMPGCEHCQRVFGALVEVAEWILPKELRPSRYELEPYDTEIRYSQKRNYRPDVTLRIKILHREEWLQPVDACEVRCLTEMQQQLRELGACEGSWTGSREVSHAKTA